MRDSFIYRFNGFVKLHALLSEKNDQRVFPRRFNFPLKKKSNVAEVSDLAYLFFKRSATNFFVTLFAHGKVLYSCSSGLVGLKKKQRRWSNAAFLIGAHFFTFLKHYFSVRSGTTVYRNKPLGNIIVILRSPIYLFTLFYVSFSRNYKYLSSQLSLRRVISYRASYSDLVLVNRSKNKRESFLTPFKYSYGESELIHYLSNTYTCYSLYFKNNASWLNRSKWYYSETIRCGMLTRIMDAFLRSTDLVQSPMYGKRSSASTTLSSFFFSFRKASNISTSIFPVECYHSHSYMHFPNTVVSSFVNASFFPFLGSVYFRSNNEIMPKWTYSSIDALNREVSFFAAGYFQSCSTFNISFFFSLCNTLCSSLLQSLHRVSSSYMLSLFFFNILNTCIIPSMPKAQDASVTLLRDSIIRADWSLLYNNMFVLNVLVLIGSFQSMYYDALCLLLRSCVVTYKTLSDIPSILSTSYLPSLLHPSSFFLDIVSDRNALQGVMLATEPIFMHQYNYQSRSSFLRDSTLIDAFTVSFQLRTRRLKVTKLEYEYESPVISTLTQSSTIDNVCLQISTYGHLLKSRLLVVWPCGYNAVTSTLFTRVLSDLYTLFLKRTWLLQLYSTFFTYSFFITSRFFSMSLIYFFNFFFSVFFMRGWTAYFADALDFSRSSITKTQSVLSKLNDDALLNDNNDFSRLNSSMNFNIFMFMDQSSFPFNGCKGKRKM